MEDLNQLRQEINEIKDQIYGFNNAVKTHNHDGDNSVLVNDIILSNQKYKIVANTIKANRVASSLEGSRVELIHPKGVGFLDYFLAQDAAGSEGMIYQDSGLIIDSMNGITLGPGFPIAQPVWVKANLLPGTGSNYNLGLTGTRWLNVYADNIYCTNQTAGQNITGDILFNYNGSMVFKIDENPDFLNFYNKDNELIMKLSKEGDLFLKGEVKKL